MSRECDELIAVLEDIITKFEAIRYKRQPVMTLRQREIALAADRAIMVDGRTALAKARGEA